MRLKDTGLTAQELKDMVNKYMVETYERYDFIAERAEGMYLYDEEGNAYLDFYGGVAVNSCGNRNPKVIAAIKDQLDDIMHTFNYPYTIPQALLAKKICDNNLEDFKSKVTENTIAIMIEPVQGEGGVHPATQEFIEGLRKLCDEKDMLLLFDEVQTGWGRTGAPMAYMGYGVKPDAVSMAKAVGGGMPLAACCATEKVAKAFTAGTHGSTYGGHCVTCAAGLASVTEILDNNLSENAKEMGEYMKQELAKLPHVKEARGRGLLVGCEYDIPIAVEVKHGCLDRMALITAIGDSVNRMIPPLIVTKKQIDELMLIMRASIEDAAAKYESK